MSATPKPWTRARIETLIYAGDSEALRSFCEQAAHAINTFDEAKVALQFAITEKGAYCLQHTETPGAMVRRLNAITDTVKAVLAKMEGANDPH